MLRYLRDIVAGFVTRVRGDEYYASLYRDMHGYGAFRGLTWMKQVETLERTIENIGSMRILDFGCGPLGGLARKYGDSVLPYDPFVAKFSDCPWHRQFDVCFSSDVLEHMKVKDVDEFLRQVRATEAHYVFLNISTRRAKKNLPNGTNAHLTVRPAEWWLRRIARGLGGSFRPVLAINDLLRSEVTVCFSRSEHQSNQEMISGGQRLEGSCQAAV
jgi:hypothetical protein